MQPVLSIQSLWLLLPLVRKIIRAREESLQSLHWYRTWKRTLEGVNPSLKCQVRLSESISHRRATTWCMRARVLEAATVAADTVALAAARPAASRRFAVAARAHGILKVNSVATASSAAGSGWANRCSGAFADRPTAEQAVPI